MTLNTLAQLLGLKAMEQLLRHQLLPQILFT
jgi:hypothetical protein